MEKALGTLRLFIEKSTKLEGLRFTRHLREGGTIGFSSVAHGDGFLFQREGPDEDAIDAFVLTLRFFIQDNESISLRNMEKLFSTLPLDPAWIEAVSKSRRNINAVLDKASLHEIGGRQLTRREVLDVFLWGGLAHANPTFKATYDRWAQHEVGFLTLQMEFTSILVDLLNGILWFRKASHEALEILSTERGGDGNQPR